MWGTKCLLLVALLACAVHAQTVLSNVFGSNMVLQRAPIGANLFGWSTPSDTIAVAFNNGKYSATADSTGAWVLTLPPTEAGGPYDISVASTTNTSNAVTITNVLFGDVILCGGQSNMQFTVNAVFNATEALQAAGNYSTIRVLTVGQDTTSSTPLNELSTIEQAWSVATSESIGEGAAAFSYFSAVCWFTAVNIQKYYPDVPLGLVSSNWGGTIIQAWSSPDALAQCPQTASAELTIYDKLAQSPELYAGKNFEVDSGPGPGTYSALWNAMIVPFLQMRLSAFLWYQAEANVGQTDLYRCLFPAMINDWRVKWGIGNTPFFFAQLAPYTTDGPLPYPWSLADMRLAQAAGLSLPNVGMISTIDLGDTGSPFTNIHPRDKQDVGYRMALAANAILYGVPFTVYSGPTLSSATIVSNYPNVQIVLDFLPTTLGSGLSFREASCPSGIATNLCSTWEVGLSDGSWHNATASVTQTYAVLLEFTGNTTSGPTVAAARYLYNNWPVATLYNSEGLPANPFYFTFVQ